MAVFQWAEPGCVYTAKSKTGFPLQMTWIKIGILVLLLALLISLGSGLVFLFIDRGRTRRTLYSLGTRLVLAAALMILLAYGLWSGQLGSRAPWDLQRAVSQDVDEQE